MVRPYTPYQRKTYAQVVASTPNTSANTSPNNSLTSSRPSSPRTPPGTHYFISPHSPSPLRFPPEIEFLEDAAVKIPSFKVLLELTGIPVHLWRESEVIRAVSSFGVYLGTVRPKEMASLQMWMVAVATDNLSDIPQSIGMIAGGLEYDIRVKPITWASTPIYKRTDLPMLPQKFSRPKSPELSPPKRSSWSEDEELVPISTRNIQ